MNTDELYTEIMDKISLLLKEMRELRVEINMLKETQANSAIYFANDISRRNKDLLETQDKLNQLYRRVVRGE